MAATLRGVVTNNNSFDFGNNLDPISGTASQSPMKPIKIYEKLKLICKHLVHGRQEDAHEFLR